MGGGTSKPTTIDYVVSVNGEAVDTITLPPIATLAHARTEIQLDAIDGIQGLPTNGHFQFILSNGTPVAPRKEQDRRIQDALNDGSLVLRPTNQEEKMSQQDNDGKADVVREATTTTDSTDINSTDPNNIASNIGAAASTTLDGIDTAETIADTMQGEFTETTEVAAVINDSTSWALCLKP